MAENQNFNEYRYFGEWKGDKRVGQGELTTFDYEKFVGEWKKDCPKNGIGEYTYFDGGVYIGQWRSGTRSG